MKVILKESQYNALIRNMVSVLNEDAESNAMKVGIKYIMSRGYTAEKAKEIFSAIRVLIPQIHLPLYTNTNGRQKGTYKFAIGICRIFLNGELENEETLNKFKRCMAFLASEAHANDYDNDLNGMNAQAIINKFGPIANNAMEQEKQELDTLEYNGSDYTIVKIPDFETASQYGDYNEWCVANYEEMYNKYTCGGLGLFYFCLKDGFEDVEAVKGEGCPLDEYGLSMIAVSVNADGSPNTITCRWNHDNGANDNVMTPKELSELIGQNFYKVFQSYGKEEIQERLKNNIFVVRDIIKDQLDYETSYNYDYFDADYISSYGVKNEEGDDEYDSDTNHMNHTYWVYDGWRGVHSIGEDALKWCEDYEILFIFDGETLYPAINDFFDSIACYADADLFIMEKKGKKALYQGIFKGNNDTYVTQIIPFEFNNIIVHSNCTLVTVQGENEKWGLYDYENDKYVLNPNHEMIHVMYGLGNKNIITAEVVQPNGAFVMLSFDKMDYEIQDSLTKYNMYRTLRNGKVFYASVNQRIDVYCVDDDGSFKLLLEGMKECGGSYGYEWYLFGDDTVFADTTKRYVVNINTTQVLDVSHVPYKELSNWLYNMD